MNRTYHLSMKIGISVFILFHWTCVMAWLMPSPSAAKTYLMSIRIPFIESSHKVVSTYFYHTSTWQKWSMFAPDPIRCNGYMGGIVYFEDGSQKEFSLPQFSQMNFFEAWIQKHYLNFHPALMDRKWSSAFSLGLARYMARKLNTDPNSLPVRVVINKFQYFLPAHNRSEIQEPDAPKWIDYTKLLRQDTECAAVLMRNYTVRPEDLR